MKGTALAVAMVLICTVGLVSIVARVARAAELDPLAPVQAYTTDDPIDPARLGLATSDGRYAVTLIECEQPLGAGSNVRVYPNWIYPPYLGLSAVDMDTPTCTVRVEGRMDSTPCYQNADGDCDVALESDQ